MRSVSPPITSPTPSITAKVSTYWTSDTANVKYGGTKKKSNAATLRSDANSEAPRPAWAATATVATRYGRISVAGSKKRKISQEIAMPLAQARHERLRKPVWLAVFAHSVQAGAFCGWDGGKSCAQTMKRMSEPYVG